MITPMLEIGVVIPVHNRCTILLETLPFVLAQSFRPARLVIVDDGSTDGTGEAAVAFLKQHGNDLDWQVLRKPKSSAAAARKAGYELVRDLPLVTFLDSDDHWPTDFLHRAATELGQNPVAAAASTNRRYIDAEGRKQAEDCSELAVSPHLWFFNHGGGVASCTVLRTSAVDAAGGWKPDLETAEDAELFCKVALEGAWIHLSGQPVVFNLGDAKKRSEQNNLSRSFSNTHHRWVVIYEQIYHELLRLSPRIDRKPFQRALAKRWRQAGKQHVRRGDLTTARTCFRKSLRWRPTDLSTWRWMAKAPIVTRRAG